MIVNTVFDSTDTEGSDVHYRTMSGRSPGKTRQAMEGGMDRRAARTRRALHGALISLILRKGYDAITVQEIIDEADVGRATFYAHYRGKEDLLRGGFEELRAELRAAPGAWRQCKNSLCRGPLHRGRSRACPTSCDAWKSIAIPRSRKQNQRDHYQSNASTVDWR
jgi:AcrR family transcriptional regulator